jgi:hypothetical protein
MNWTNITAEYQNKVLQELNFLAEEALNEGTGGDPILANAYLAAADELSLWINNDRQNDPFSLWLEKQKGELLPHAGKAVAVHLDKGIIETGEAESFWDGSFRKQVIAAFGDDPKIFLSVVPINPSKEEGVVQATDPTEHSRLLYLVDALQGAPVKSGQLFSIAEREGGSESYLGVIKRLRVALAEGRLVEETHNIKRELR